MAYSVSSGTPSLRLDWAVAPVRLRIRRTRNASRPDMHSVVMLIIVSVLAAPASAQTVADSFEALQAILKPGQMLVVIDHTRQETTGTVMQLSASSLTILARGGDTRTFTDNAVYSIRRTDPLGNGTLNGMLAGAALSGAMLLGCGQYRYAEESGPCLAQAVASFIMTVPVGALIGRAIYRAIGNQEVFYRPRPRQARVALAPAFSKTGIGVLTSVSF